MKEKMQKKSGRWWFWRKRADSTVKQVCKYGKKKAGKTQSQTQTFQYIFSSQISQSETKHETKEESQLEEEGAAILQDKLSLQ